MKYVVMTNGPKVIVVVTLSELSLAEAEHFRDTLNAAIQSAKAHQRIITAPQG